jgi:curved DNA-binding protein CbpA
MMTPDAAARTLGIGAASTRDDIEKAYRRKARATHPDLMANESAAAIAAASATFMRITEARDVLFALAEARGEPRSSAGRRGGVLRFDEFVAARDAAAWTPADSPADEAETATRQP